MVFEYIKQNLEQYWPIIILTFSSMFCSYFAKLACKLCMQLAGFSVPLLLSGPVTVSQGNSQLGGACGGEIVIVSQLAMK